MLVVAHRMPTSATSCRALASAGADVFEIDVQVGAAGLIMSHYAPVPRLGQLHRDGWRLRWGQSRTLLAAQLEFLPDGARVLLDLKERTAEGRAVMIKAITSFADKHRYVTSGSHLDDFAILREAGIETWRSIGHAQALQRVLDAKDIGADGVTVRHTLLTHDVVRRLHDTTPRVITWTVNSRSRAAALRDMGVDGVTTDRAAVMRLLKAR